MDTPNEKDDLEIDDILGDLVSKENKQKKKKIRSGDKGKGAEREIVHLLNERFAKILKEHPKWGEFSRSVGSGNRWGQQVALSETSLQIYAGDITCPETFLWVIESKKGYNDADLCSCFGGKCQELDGFLKQVSDDASRTGRRPLLIWKKDRKERVAFIKQAHLPFPFIDLRKTTALLYKEWVAIPLPLLLESPDDVFFNGKEETTGTAPKEA